MVTSQAEIIDRLHAIDGELEAWKADPNPGRADEIRFEIRRLLMDIRDGKRLPEGRSHG